MVLAVILVTFVLILSRAITYFFALSICAYLSQKPMGMQTVFDIMVKDLLWSMIILSIDGDAINIDWGQPWNIHLAWFAMIFQHGMALVFFNQIFSTFLVRYWSVFHGSMINEWNEEYLVFTIRFFIWMGSVMATTYEVIYNDYGTGPVYQSLTKVEQATEPKPSFLLALAFIFVFFFSLFFFIRIEWFKFKTKSKDDGDNDLFDSIQSNIGAIRSATFIAIGTVILSVSYIAIPFFIEKEEDVYVMKLYVHTTVAILMMILVIIYVKKSPNIVKYIDKKLPFKVHNGSVGVLPH